MRIRLELNGFTLSVPDTDDESIDWKENSVLTNMIDDPSAVAIRIEDPGKPIALAVPETAVDWAQR